MTGQQHLNYHRIAEAIGYIQLHFKTQPTLAEVAEKLHLSPFHFQRLFTEWAGVSPKKFLQYISLAYAKSLLVKKEATLFDAAAETGLSGTGRLHDLFVKIEGMTPGEYRAGAESLCINYSFADTPFGRLLIASTPKGVCHAAFTDNEEQALQRLACMHPAATLRPATDAFQRAALAVFAQNADAPPVIRLHLRGTGFQLKVWEALLKIPSGRLSTYGTLAGALQNSGASRAVGTAIGSNPVAFIIPCHRVIQSSGAVGGYMWGATRKTAMIGWEAAMANGLEE